MVLFWVAFVTALVACLIPAIKSLTRPLKEESLLLTHVAKAQFIEARESWHQELKTAAPARCSPEVNRDKCWYSAHSLLSCQSGIPDKEDDTIHLGPLS